MFNFLKNSYYVLYEPEIFSGLRLNIHNHKIQIHKKGTIILTGFKSFEKMKEIFHQIFEKLFEYELSIETNKLNEIIDFDVIDYNCFDFNDCINFNFE